MNKVAIIDLDGVVADNTARFAKAEEAKAAYLASQDMEDALENHGVAYLEKEAINLYWRTAFTPDLVQLDTLIDGASIEVRCIAYKDYDVYFLTSRPESMRDATLQWLSDNNVYQASRDKGNRLIMKPVSQQFVKTVVWKSGVVELLVRLFGVGELLFVDDEQAIQEAIAALDLPCDCKIGGNLQEALAML